MEYLLDKMECLLDKMEYLYIVKEGIHKSYKIGRSYDVDQRIKTLQTSNSNKLSLINKYECRDCVILETKIHNNLKHKKLIGEWFYLEDNELNICIETIHNLINHIHNKLNTNTCLKCNFSTYKNKNFRKHNKKIIKKNAKILIFYQIIFINAINVIKFIIIKMITLNIQKEKTLAIIRII